MPSPNKRAKPVYLRWSVWCIYAVLFSIAIPWYWPAEDAVLTLGVPLWAAVSTATSALISAFTAWLLMRHWPTESELDSADD